MTANKAAMQIEHRAPWLIATLNRPMQVLSWAPYRCGLVEARQVAWREVRDADLSREFDVTRWLEQEVDNAGLREAVTLLTSRDLSRHHTAQHSLGSARVPCLATVGLGNAERVGARVAPVTTTIGTINVLAVIDAGLTTAAMFEALSIATEARTLAIIEANRNVGTGLATGTGTDCIAIAASRGQTRHVGKHTDVGEAIGRAVYETVSKGADEWMRENA